MDIFFSIFIFYVVKYNGNVLFFSSFIKLNDNFHRTRSIVFFLLKNLFWIINNIIIMSNLIFMVEYHDDYSKDERYFLEKIRALIMIKYDRTIFISEFFIIFFSRFLTGYENCIWVPYDTWRLLNKLVWILHWICTPYWVKS